MSHLPSNKSLLRLLLLSSLFLATLLFLAPNSVLHAQSAGPLLIVGNDGSSVALSDSGKFFSDSYKPALTQEALVNETVNAKNLKPLGGTSPDSVIGPDGRTQITNTSAYPNSAIAFLEVNFPGGSGSCTGWFMSKNRLATAGHCVYESSLGGWATSITVYPGRNGGTAPFGSYSAASWYTVTDRKSVV